MKPNGALQTIFAFFLGLLVLAFVSVAIGTFLPEPDWSATNEAARDSWQLTNGIVLLICATALLAASLFLPESQVVLSNGILLGGVFTMVYGVVAAFISDAGLLRFAVVTAALAVTIAIGYLRFVRGRRIPNTQVPISAPAEGVPSDIVERVMVVERKLDAIGTALRS
jgi:VIT1/CCC1 family predicted Fe2+/Mn2+ transporter